MKDELISFETAKLAKEKGFKLQSNPFGYVTKFYNHNTGALLSYGRTGRTDISKAYYAPTQSLLQKWLREKHKINVKSNYLPNIPGYRCLFVPMTDKISAKEKYKLFSKYYGIINYDTYEEALEAGLQEALKLIQWEK
jgi:hypothetical protein